MKNFLIEFFRPIDNLIFNYFVKKGFIKCINPALIQAGMQVVGGILGDRSARKAAERSQQMLNQALGELRDPSEIIRDAYSTGIYSTDVMDTILGAERELIPQFQQLAETKARGVRDIQEESKLRQLGLLGQYGQDIRETLEDPRLSQLAALDLSEAQRLTEEAAGPLGLQAMRTADQTALELGLRLGRVGDASTIARAALGRDDALRARRDEAADARQKALQSATAAMVDPAKFFFTPSAEEKIFTSTPLGTQVTDPGMAATLGSALDVQRANVLLGKGVLESQAGATSAKILGDTIQGIGNTFADADFGSQGARATIPSNVPGGVGYGTVLKPPSGGFPDEAAIRAADIASGFRKLFNP
tara:strand:- start:4772 stop:5854 length:1083 start_codon:yes stop_codon:yes gene_type:complete